MRIATLIAIFLSLDRSWAVPGIYFSSNSLANKWLPNPMESRTALNEPQCKRFCIQHPKCTGYAISAFERKCRMYEVQNGTPPVKNNGYTLYIKKKTEEEGYYAHKTNYIKLYTTYMNAKDAEKQCEKEKGLLVSVRNKEIDDLLLKIMINHSVWRAFIGLSDEDVEGNWIYSDTGPATYTNWEWNGMWPRKDLNCAVVKSTLDGPVWRHVSCWIKEYFFCQIPMF